MPVLLLTIRLSHFLAHPAIAFVLTNNFLPDTPALQVDRYN
ncbi:hypothetical protein ACM66I_10440 [Escherichia coli]